MSSRAGNLVLVSEDPQNDATLLDILDHVLNAGIVLHGNIVISLAGVDLVYLGLNVVLASVETALRQLDSHFSHAGPGRKVEPFHKTGPR